jgi:hypothetical protein
VHAWTVDEVRVDLPRVRELVDLIRRSVAPGDAPETYALPAGAEHAEAALLELQERGVILRQLAAGLLDFPSVTADGEVRLLCWKIDEPDLAWWHRPEDGFAGRRPLDG